MVWAAVTADGLSSIIFDEAGVKVNAQYYRESIQEAALKPWAEKHFDRRTRTFQQDSTPSHKGRVNEEWLKTNVSNFNLSLPF